MYITYSTHSVFWAFPLICIISPFLCRSPSNHGEGSDSFVNIFQIGGKCGNYQKPSWKYQRLWLYVRNLQQRCKLETIVSRVIYQCTGFICGQKMKLRKNVDSCSGKILLGNYGSTPGVADKARSTNSWMSKYSFRRSYQYNVNTTLPICSNYCLVQTSWICARVDLSYISTEY